ncbi:MAG: choice-of-anchor L domain-containing protein, partial [Flavobacteriales bacterium]|nr:choice-of-anchor L domain-containing protein [Flavobacteriales bacterium]
MAENSFDRIAPYDGRGSIKAMSMSQQSNFATASTGKKQLVSLAAALVFSGIALDTTAQLTVNETASNATMISQLEGNAINIIDATFTINGSAHDRQVCHFTNIPSAELPLPNGVLITTGYGSEAVGPNNTTSRSTDVPGNGTTNDPDLMMIEPLATNDVVIIEFDFIPKLDTLQISFVWASEEYCEYTCSEYNDAFAFLVSGPGLSGPYSNSAENFAILPNGTDVEINNVHNGNCNGWYSPCNPTNAAYYYNNTGGTYLQADGLTIGLKAQG